MVFKFYVPPNTLHKNIIMYFTLKNPLNALVILTMQSVIELGGISDMYTPLYDIPW